MPNVVCKFKERNKMRLVTIILTFVLFETSGYSQLNVDGSDYLKKPIADSINEVVEIKVNQFRKQNKNLINNEKLDFSSDTLRIETYFSIAKEKVKYEDLGVLLLSQEALEKYDLLLNKYYKILSDKTENKSALTSAEKSWITFRDKEIDFYISTITDDYSTLGSLDKVWIATYRLKLTKLRTIDIFNYVIR
jgi:uncharacterized protein YecT (DUF1311 family)